MKMYFICKTNYRDQDPGRVSVSIGELSPFSNNGITLPSAIYAFEEFLRGCGFHFKGSLTIVEDSDDEREVACSD